jgi:membrane protein DedA with SNARE-associated domain
MVFEVIAEWAVSSLASGGYVWIAFLMSLESMIFPMPSEVVMPLSGYLIAQAKFTWIGVFVASTLGSVIGSLISYWIGLFGGRRFLRKFGKYVFLDEEHLDWTQKFFKKHGTWTVFVSRFLPVVRHLISIPAGMGKMGLKKFLLYTALGSAGWNMFLAWLGWYLNEYWHLIHDYALYFDWVILGILIILVGFLVFKFINKKRKVNKRDKSN